MDYKSQEFLGRTIFQNCADCMYITTSRDTGVGEIKGEQAGSRGRVQDTATEGKTWPKIPEKWRS